ncbi:E3 ubiquitin-protein ligase MARCHF6 isoform X2 [Nematostella vectensis]|uniref:E3 ubiquitin-protein ligase MARCHF6 isoform X2 n=1 Tax=Nematostella vectensis TaxID=45351 RepID=UPI0020776D49|nr:E3 ubiquitin-protein ligase MARCHF6 isoform X2 [Nematostella vectensis]
MLVNDCLMHPIIFAIETENKMADAEDREAEVDICRVCRAEGTPDKPLYFPCICTGSIKYIHQECLLQWLKHSKKEYCELCNHRFTFKPIYAPDMPPHLPVRDFISGLSRSILRAVRYWFHYTLVAIAWLGVVPITAYRIYRCLFAGSVSSLLTLPLDMLSTENVFMDCVRGCFVVACTLCAFISLVWLREQIVLNGGPDWLEPNMDPLPQLPANLFGGPQGVNVGAGGGVFGGADVMGDIEDPGDEENMEEEDADPPNEAELPENAANNGEDDVNWNPVEWDRAAEELTWERMLGLDGSLVFLEHVFWVVSLNTSFILVFAFCPFHIGQFAVILFSVEEAVQSSRFEGVITTVLGYIILAASLVICHTVSSFFSFKRARRIFGLCYVVVKVSLLMVVEIGLFPLVCGWWLDICSLALFGATLKERVQSIGSAPGTAMFLHWLVGMVYVFYFASFVLLLREVLRPGVLWFLRNLNDPDFHPVQEMIRLPVHRHARRFLLSLVVFGTTVLLMMYLPVSLIKAFVPSFLPYNVQLSSEAPVSELSLELLLLQVVLPALLEQGHTRQWLKNLIKGWAVTAAYILDLRSYLIGDVPLDGQANVFGLGLVNNAPVNLNVNPDQNGAELQGPQAQLIPQPQAAHNPDGAVFGFQPYIRPKMFVFKIVLLVIFMCMSLSFASFVILTVPVGVGRAVMCLWMGSLAVHELYTAACGLYLIWLVCRTFAVIMSWVPLGVIGIAKKLGHWMLLGLKCVLIAVVLIGVVPLLLGLLFELIVVVPLRVPLDQTPLYFPWQDWALGVLHMKIICAVTMMGPNWWLKAILERVYNDGIRNINTVLILRRLAVPVVLCLLLAVTVPYVIANGIIPIFISSADTVVFCQRRIYPFLLAVFMLIGCFMFQGRQFKMLYERIKNDKYLVGQRLVNYENHRRSIGTTTSRPKDDKN